jgi:predicted HTH domain antitoxin
MATKKSSSGSPRRSSAEKRKIDRIVKLYQSGWTLRRITEKEHVREDKVRKILTARGIPNGLIGRLTRFPVTDPDFLEKYIDSVYELFKVGVSMQAIADQKNIRKWVVRELLLRRNVNHFPPGRRTARIHDSTSELIVKLYQSGLTVVEVHKKTKVATYYISKILREHRVPIRNAANRRSLIDKQQAEEAIRRYQSGQSLERSVAQLGLSVNFLKSFLAERNIPLRQQQPKSSTPVRTERHNRSKTKKSV